MEKQGKCLCMNTRIHPPVPSFFCETLWLGESDPHSHQPGSMHVCPSHCQSGVQTSGTSQECNNAQAWIFCCAPGQSPKQISWEQVWQYYRSSQDRLCEQHDWGTSYPWSTSPHSRQNEICWNHRSHRWKAKELDLYYGCSRLPLTYMVHTVNVWRQCRDGYIRWYYSLCLIFLYWEKCWTG